MVLASVATLVVGWYFSEDITLIYASLATSVAAAILVLVGVATHRRLRPAAVRRAPSTAARSAATTPPTERTAPAATYYDVLGVSPTATEDEVRHAYMIRLGMYDLGRHPGASDELRREADRSARQLEEAWAVLRDPNRRALYDARIRQSERV